MRYLSKVTARHVPVPQALLKEITDWAVPRALSIIFKERKAPPSLYKKYNVPNNLAPIQPNKTEIKTFRLHRGDLKTGTMAKEFVDLHVGVTNMLGADKGALAVFLPQHPAIGVYQPWKMHTLDAFNIESYIKDLKASIVHEFIHFVQWVSAEGIGGRIGDVQKGDKYFLSEHEYKPQLLSAVRRFEADLELIDQLKKKPERKHLEQFVGLKVHRPSFGSFLGEVVTDPLFWALKKNDPQRWKRAIKEFLELLRSSPEFHYKTLLGI